MNMIKELVNNGVDMNDQIMCSRQKTRMASKDDMNNKNVKLITARVSKISTWRSKEGRSDCENVYIYQQ